MNTQLFNMLHMTWEIWIKHVGCTRNHSGCYKRHPGLRCRLSSLALFLFFSYNTVFIWRSDWQTNWDDSDLGIWQTFFEKGTERACHFKENNWKYLLPKIKLELSSKNEYFWKACICHSELDSFPVLRDISEIGGNINEYVLKIYCTIKCVNIWKIFMTQWTNIFQGTKKWCYKVMSG